MRRNTSYIHDLVFYGVDGFLIAPLFIFSTIWGVHLQGMSTEAAFVIIGALLMCVVFSAAFVSTLIQHIKTTRKDMYDGKQQ